MRDFPYRMDLYRKSGGENRYRSKKNLSHGPREQFSYARHPPETHRTPSRIQKTHLMNMLKKLFLRWVHWVEKIWSFQKSFFKVFMRRVFFDSRWCSMHFWWMLRIWKMFSGTMGIYWYRRKYHTTRQWHFTAGKRHFHRFQQNDTRWASKFLWFLVNFMKCFKFRWS